MGKVRPSNIKILARKLVSEYPNDFTSDFENNKSFLNQIADMKTKRFRNRTAGYVTRLVRIEEERLDDLD